MKILAQEYDFADVLILPQRSTLNSRQNVVLQRTFHFKYGQEWTGIPIMSANMDTTGTFEIAEKFSEQNLITCLHKHYTVQQFCDHERLINQISENIAVSAGMSEEDFEKVSQIFEFFPEIKWICLDVANGHQESFVDVVKKYREIFPNKIIIAGNVVTAGMTEELLINGADIVKCGIGPGSVCTTRLITGVGRPQLSTIEECGNAAHGLEGHIIGDGGIQNIGDFSKAFCAGADFVMVGGLFAGHTESGGTTEEIDGLLYKIYYGMSSQKAMEKNSGPVATYKASEGKVVRLLHRGHIEPTINNILGGIRSCCAYIGARELKHMSRRAIFVLVNNQANQMYS
jgi:GMP reductase